MRNSGGKLIGIIYGPRKWAIEPYFAIKYNNGGNRDKQSAFNSLTEAKEWILE